MDDAEESARWLRINGYVVRKEYGKQGSHWAVIPQCGAVRRFSNGELIRYADRVGTMIMVDARPGKRK